MEALTFLLAVFLFIYVFADKFNEQTKALLAKLIDLLPTPGNFRILVIILLLLTIIIIGLLIYFRYNSSVLP